MKDLILTRPIIFLDLETTGTDVARDRITEIAMVKFYPHAAGEAPSYPDEFSQLVNPGRPLSEEVEQLTGITNEMIATAPTFNSVAPLALNFLTGCDIAGFGVEFFDVPMLWEEFHRADLELDLEGVAVLDLCNIFKKREPRTLAAALRFYCGADHTGAHRAMADVNATIDVLGGQLARYPDLPRNLADLAKESKVGRRLDLAGKIELNADGVPCYTIGEKTKGVPVIDAPDFGYWMLRSNFPEQTKRILRKILEGAPQLRLEIPGEK